MNYTTFSRNLNILVFSLALITLTLFSCKKEENRLENGEPTKLVFTVSGVKESSNNIFASLPTNTEAVIPTAQHQKLNSQKVSLQTISSTEDIKAPLYNSSATTSKQIKNKLAALVPMTEGYKYRILLYNANTGAYETTVLATAGTTVEIPAVKNRVYKYYAYAYNNTDDIPVPTNLTDPTIETPTDKDFLYASGTCSANEEGTPIPLTFSYKTSQIVLKIDSDRLFGEIISYDIEFADNYLNKGEFSIKNGTLNSTTTYSSSISFNEVDTTQSNTRIARFYVADPSAITSYKVKVNSILVKFPNEVQEELITTPQEVEFDTFSGELGKKFTGTLKLWYNFASRTILHVTRSVGEVYAYAAQPHISNISLSGAAFNMINEKRNYGNLPNSIVRTGNFVHKRCSVDGQMSDYLAEKPDITIISVYYRMDEDDRTSLVNYINQGGVVLLMTDGSVPADRNAQIDFFRTLFNEPSINVANNNYGAGALYKLSNIDDEILNGPFGDVRGKHWGEDASATQAVSNLPENDITLYSEAKAANGTAAATGATMFKHKRKHFFWIGDGGFLSNELDNGIYNSNTIEPFATVNTAIAASRHPDPRYNYNNYPIPKPYGYAGNGIAAGSTLVYNSVIFANIMSWAIANAEFFGINTGGLPEDYVDL